MSLMDRIKSMFSGGSSDEADAHAGHDHSDHDHSHEPAVPPLPQADPAVMPTSDAAPAEEGETRPG
jgi:hypothetical protein